MPPNFYQLLSNPKGRGKSGAQGESPIKTLQPKTDPLINARRYQNTVYSNVSMPNSLTKMNIKYCVHSKINELENF